MGDLIQQAAPVAALTSLHQLPAAVDLVGRDTVLDELVGSLSATGSAGATISAAGVQGMPGVGKTALAVALAHRLKGRYPAAQLMLNLRGADAAPATPEEIMQRVIQSFHPEKRVPDDPAALAAAYTSVLTEAGGVLLLFDNAADAEQVRPLLPPPNCLLLVTSRVQFSLSGLKCRALDCLTPDASRALLLKLAPRLDGHAAEAASLCDHLPLALEVFAGVVAERIVYEVPDLIDRLRRGALTLGKVDAAFALSAELLPADLRHRWFQLAVFPVSFDLAAAAAVWGDASAADIIPDTARDAMQALVRASLVEHHTEQKRFRLHDLARRFGESRLAKDEETAARLRHAEYYCAVGAKADELYLKGGSDVVRGLALFDRERAQLNAAYGWLRGQTDATASRLTIRLVDAIVYVGVLRFHPRERIQWLETHLAASRRVDDRHSEGNALGNLGNAYFVLGETRKAIDYHELALVIDREIGDRYGEAQDLGNLGVAYGRLGEPRKAIDYYEQQLVIAREIGDRRGEGNALWNSALLLDKPGDLPHAVARAEEALRIYESVEHPSAAKVRAQLAAWRGEQADAAP